MRGSACDGCILSTPCTAVRFYLNPPSREEHENRSLERFAFARLVYSIQNVSVGGSPPRTTIVTVLGLPHYYYYTVLLLLYFYYCNPTVRVVVL